MNQHRNLPSKALLLGMILNEGCKNFHNFNSILSSTFSRTKNLKSIRFFIVTCELWWKRSQYFSKKTTGNKDSKQIEWLVLPGQKLTELIMVVKIVFLLITENSTVKYVGVLNHLYQG